MSESYIYQTFPSLRAVPSGKELVNTIQREAERKDKLIKAAAASCTYKVGDICRPINKKDQEQYGTNILVEHICESYAQFGSEWPKNEEVLMIVGAVNTANGSRFHCTPNYLEKV